MGEALGQGVYVVLRRLVRDGEVLPPLMSLQEKGVSLRSTVDDVAGLVGCCERLGERLGERGEHLRPPMKCLVVGFQLEDAGQHLLADQDGRREQFPNVGRAVLHDRPLTRAGGRAGATRYRPSSR